MNDRNGAFPAGGGELGQLIRDFDWADTSLGPIGAWPQSLKTATDIVLQSPLPLVMLWGPDGVMIYNDAYSIFAAQRHPRLLGSKVLEGWPEVADFNAHVMQVVLAGGTLSFKDQDLTLYRNHRAEQVWMDLNYSPVFDESGRPAGVLAIVVENTARVLAERRNLFLFQLGDRLRDLSNPRLIIGAVVEMLGGRLEVDRAGWAEIDEAEGTLDLVADWTAEGGLILADPTPRLACPPAWLAALKTGRAIRIDAATDHAPADTAPAPGADVRTVLTAPLMLDGRLAACFFAHSRARHRWTEEEKALVRDATERTFGAAQRAIAQIKVRESEARLRALVNATSDVVYQMSADWIEMRQLDGRGFLQSTHGPSVAWMDINLFPEDQPAIWAAIQEAIVKKEPFQREHRVRRADGSVGWTFSKAIPILDEAGEITDWFGVASDVTARRQSEEHLRLVINELNHRVKNNLAMIQAISAQTFRNARDLPAVKENFAARIMALAKANDLLTTERWVDASLRQAIESALQPHFVDGSRCMIDGPMVRLSAKTALSLSMAMHELATNAVKYGAWSNERGRVTVGWWIDPGLAGERLRLEWRESDGPRVLAPKQRGFGSRLIERGLSAELEGEVLLRFEPDGLICAIDAPLRGYEPS